MILPFQLYSAHQCCHLSLYCPAQLTTWVPVIHFLTFVVAIDPFRCITDALLRWAGIACICLSPLRPRTCHWCTPRSQTQQCLWPHMALLLRNNRAPLTICWKRHGEFAVKLLSRHVWCQMETTTSEWIPTGKSLPADLLTDWRAGIHSRFQKSYCGIRD